ncbi:hypothetical protein [Lysobacter sp. 22409]|uniref:hypothetical protein n=1 Tax=Lysobacter sp. 22409 TaxID=3453917 RepID=UPI003F872546
MQHATDLHTGKVVAAENALWGRAYVCPRPGCGGQVYLPHVSKQTAHFRHYPGEGTKECDEYYPSNGGSVTSVVPVAGRIEDDPAELGLLLVQVDDRWALGIRLPEIPDAQLGASSLKELCNAFVEIAAGPECSARVSALDLRPGVGIARVDIAPSTQTFRTQAAGTWPAAIDKSLWKLECKGLDAKGALFRLRSGEWMRLLAGSGVYPEETVLLIADARHAPPESVVSARHAQISTGTIDWAIWEICVSDQPNRTEEAWLARLGHGLIPRRWRVELVTPPRMIGEHGEPVFWIGDAAMLLVHAPGDAAQAQATYKFGTNCYCHTIAVSDDRQIYVAVDLRHLGSTRFSISGEKTASVELSVRFRPSDAKSLKALEQTPRLRIWIGDMSFESWQRTVNEVPAVRRSLPEVRVELGTECARAQVKAWERGKQRISSGLDGPGTAKFIQEFLSTASRIEVDAGNFGKIVLTPLAASHGAARSATDSDRLRLYDRVLQSASRPGDIAVQAEAMHGSGPARHVGNAVLVRERLAQRRRQKARGDFK